MKSLIKSSLFIGMSLMLALLTERRFWRESNDEVNRNDPPDHPEAAGPLPGIHPVRAPREVVSGPLPATTVIFSGRLMRNGEQYVLREIAGALYPLESAGRASSYEDEDVRVTGKLDLSTRMLHVDAIEPAVL